MRLFHLSDLHLGLKLLNRDLKEDQEYILDQVVQLAEREKPDAVLIAGDIYDKSLPPSEAVELFSWFVDRLRAALPDTVLMMISGNHDSAARLNCFRNVLQGQNVYMIGQPPRSGEEGIARVRLMDEWGPVNFYLLPFVRPSMVRALTGGSEGGGMLSYHDTVRCLLERERINTDERNVLVSHQFYLPSGKKAEEIDRTDSEIRTVGNIDEVKSEVLQPFDYAALGHIHRGMKVGEERFRYCGTLLPCSVSEAGDQKAVLMVDLQEKGNLKVSSLPLKPLRQVRICRGTLSEVLECACKDYVSVILTDREEYDVLDLQDRLRNAFPYLLEIRREGLRSANTDTYVDQTRQKDPFTLCCEFFGEPDEQHRQILQDVIRVTTRG